MSNPVNNEEEGTRRLVVAITDFIRDQLIIRTDLVPEDRDCLEIAIQCLEMAYGLEAQRYLQYRFSRPLLDIFNQVTNPISIRDKISADSHKNAGNSYMRRSMFSNAEVEYTHAIELDRWNAIYYCNRASSRIEQRHYFDAISDCRQALMLNPDYAKAHARMGQAYAMIRRPREAARCFRQALELEPTNERYRNNLRIAESQITRPDAMGIITNLLGSLFGLSPRAPHNVNSSNINLPTSFMIITENQPATRENRPEDAHPLPNQEIESEAQRPFPTETHNIVFPPPYGIIDEGEEEQAILQIDIPFDEQENQEFIRNFPGFIFFQDESPDTLTETEEDTTSEAGKTEGDATSEAGKTEKDTTSEAGKTEKDITSEAGKMEKAELLNTEDFPEGEKDNVTDDVEERQEILTIDADTLPSNKQSETERGPSSLPVTADMQADYRQKTKTDRETEPDDNIKDRNVEKRGEECDTSEKTSIPKKSSTEEISDGKDETLGVETDLFEEKITASDSGEASGKINNAPKDKEETEINKNKITTNRKKSEEPSDQTISPTDSSRIDPSENIPSSTSDTNTEQDSKKDSDMPTTATENSGATEETESKLTAKESVKNELIDNTKNQDETKTDEDLHSKKASEKEDNENSG